MSFADRLDQLLKDKRLTQSDFSEIVGHSRISMTKIINGKTKNPGIKILTGIAEHFPEVNLRWLLTGEGNMYRSATDVLPEVIPDQGPMPNQELADAQRKIIELLQEQNDQYAEMLRRQAPEVARQLGLL